MKKADIAWAALLIIITALLSNPATHDILYNMPVPSYFFISFLLFGIFASMGEIGYIRYLNNEYKMPNYILPRFLIWGCFGWFVSWLFLLYYDGSIDLQVRGFGAANISMQMAVMISFIIGITLSIIAVVVIKFANSALNCLYDNKHNAKPDNMPCKTSIFEIIDNMNLKSLLHFSFYKLFFLLWLPIFTLVHVVMGSYRIVLAIIFSLLFGIFATIIRDENYELKEHIEMGIL